MGIDDDGRVILGLWVVKRVLRQVLEMVVLLDYVGR